MRVIGTAGHVDHGKSTLVEALTGIHPDRLKEEREREMTIDLGFAWMNLPSVDGGMGEEIGIVDVPGHRDFIENMLAGIGGIDAALFVVAADEGVMPQTREHLAILDILQIQGGVVALTKIDLIDGDDNSRIEWLDLVEADLRQVLSSTVLKDAPIVRVSAITGEGTQELMHAMSASLQERPRRPDLGRPRLPVDRVFTIAGFGSVVTGTLTDGTLSVGDEVVLLPREVKGRVRGLQTHKQSEQTAIPGSRTAVNISGVPVDRIARGEVVAHPGDYRTSRRLDVHFLLLPDVSSSIKHNTEVKLYIGAAEVVARLRLLGVEELSPGQEGWLQLELKEPVVAVRSDRYILRRPSPGETLGGGTVVDPHPKGRHKRFSQDTIKSLEAMAKGTPADIIYQALLSLGTAELQEVLERSNLVQDDADQAIEELVVLSQLVQLEHQDERPSPKDLVTSKIFWEQIEAQTIGELKSYHQNYPLRRGIPKEELKSRLQPLVKTTPRLFNATLGKLVAEGTIIEKGPIVFLPGHEICFNPQQELDIKKLMRRFENAPYTPPTIKECQTEVGEDVTDALIDVGKLVQVSPEVVYREEDYAKMVAEIRTYMEQHGSMTVAQARNHFNTSRRYVLALLEYLDTVGITKREGDARRLRA